MGEHPFEVIGEIDVEVGEPELEVVGEDEAQDEGEMDLEVGELVRLVKVPDRTYVIQEVIQDPLRYQLSDGRHREHRFRPEIEPVPVTEMYTNIGHTVWVEAEVVAFEAPDRPVVQIQSGNGLGFHELTVSQEQIYTEPPGR